jgi:hypothetical protein
MLPNHKMFPPPPLKQKGSAGKARCSWRSKSKVCGNPNCANIITDLPKSLFVKRTFCSHTCKNHTKPQGASHTKTKNSVAVGFLLAEVIQSLTDWSWWDCSVMAVKIIKGK